MEKTQRYYQKFRSWAVRFRLQSKLSVILAFASMASVIATYVVLTHAPPFVHNRKLLIILLNLDLVFLLSLAGLIARRLVRLWAERRRGRAGSKLHTRMVAVFSLVAIVPTVCVAIFSALFFNIAVQSWFSERVETAIGESTSVAQAYLQEHEQVISANAQALALELQSLLSQNMPPQEALNELLTLQAQMRSLDEAVIFDPKMDIVGQSRFSFSIMFERITAEDLSKAKDRPVIYTNDRHDRVRALIQIDPQQGTYLLVGRSVSPQVLARVENAEKAAQEYKDLEREGSTFAVRFAMIFVGVALLLLLLVIWGGLLFANRLMRPIGKLIDAAQAVTKGDLSARVEQEDENEELFSLTSAFNRMTKQLQTQRHELEETNGQLDQGLRFMEAVLAGVSAGVIGLDAKGRIHIPNQSASDLLQMNIQEYQGKKLATVVPEMEPLLTDALHMSESYLESEIILERDGHARTLLVRITVERDRKRLEGFVVTFDDITELQSAQRSAAWSDVARRIAHEIKNPLTPIQLSAERLKRKYLKQIQEDPETFQACVDTIIRQVEHLGVMVSEFSSFSRMPAPQISRQDLVALCRESIFFQQQNQHAIQIQFKTNLTHLDFWCDGRQISQVLTNLLKNAQEAVEAKLTDGKGGVIQVTLTDQNEHVILAIEDNGIGLPENGRERLTEPYVTHREKGTGLGLAIVSKIVEDHMGKLLLSDAVHLSGARVVLTFKKQNDVQHTNDGDNLNGERYSDRR